MRKLKTPLKVLLVATAMFLIGGPMFITDNYTDGSNGQIGYPKLAFTIIWIIMIIRLLIYAL